MDIVENLGHFLEVLRIMVRWVFAGCFFAIFLIAAYGGEFFSLFERMILASIAIFGIGYFITLPRND